MLRSLLDPAVLFAAGAALVLLAGAIRAIARQRDDAHVSADSLIVPPRRLYTTFDPQLRERRARERARVEELQARARRASAGLPVSGEVVPMRRARS